MLSTVLATVFISFLEWCATSPVYNMQPAYITANIGTTGRNIRNLPCISRKTNQSGVCMFAIDCLKANGTHLGTCIDRFYFGSCCHIEPHHEILDNNVVPDVREPPLRLTNTTTSKPMTITKKPTLSVTTKPAVSITTTKKATITTSSELVKVKPTSTTGKPEKTTEDAEQSTTEQYKLTTFQSIETTINETSTIASNATKIVTGSSPKPTPSKPVLVAKPSTTKPTFKPFTNVTRTTSRPGSKLPTKRPVSTFKPTKISKPSSIKPTLKPSKNTTKPSARPSTTRRPATPTRLPPKPTRFTTLKPPSSTIKIIATTTQLPKNATTTAATLSTVANVTETTVASVENVIPLHNGSSSLLGSVNGNTETNEIEAVAPSLQETTGTTQKLETTTRPSLVTWASVESAQNGSETSNTTNEGLQGWKPLTTPDDWVLLPSVTPTIPPNSTTTEAFVSKGTTSTDRTTTSSTTTTEKMTSISSKPTTVSSSVEPSPPSTTTASTTSPPSSITTSAAIETSSFVLNVTSSSTVTEAGSTEAVTAANITLNVTTEKSPNVTTDFPPPLEGDRPVNMSDYTDVCGRRMYPEARIVGGEKSSFGRWPWQISLRQWRVSTYLHKCGAALLNENWAITAAHCVENVPSSDLLLRLGEHDLSTESEPYLHQERRVQIVVPYPQFDNRTFEYDLALLRFYEPVSFQPNIIPVCVPDTDENFVGGTAYVTGWGRLYEDGPLPSVLQEVSVPVINNTVCESMYRMAGYIEHIPHIFICAGWRRGGFDSCEGDSGGPMVIQRPDKRFILAGVISWGIGCAEPNQPGVYTRISEFRDWINLIIQF